MKKYKRTFQKNMNPYFISLFILIPAAYALWYFVFNIYEVKYRIILLDRSNINERVFEVENIPINLLGKKVPFRKLNFDCEITSGDSLLELIPRKSNNEMYFKTNCDTGLVTLKLKNRLSLFPQIAQIDLSAFK